MAPKMLLLQLTFSLFFLSVMFVVSIFGKNVSCSHWNWSKFLISAEHSPSRRCYDNCCLGNCDCGDQRATARWSAGCCGCWSPPWPRLGNKNSNSLISSLALTALKIILQHSYSILTLIFSMVRKPPVNLFISTFWHLMHTIDDFMLKKNIFTLL